MKNRFFAAKTPAGSPAGAGAYTNQSPKEMPISRSYSESAAVASSAVISSAGESVIFSAPTATAVSTSPEATAISAARKADAPELQADYLRSIYIFPLPYLPDIEDVCAYYNRDAGISGMTQELFQAVKDFFEEYKAQTQDSPDFS